MDKYSFLRAGGGGFDPATMEDLLSSRLTKTSLELTGKRAQFGVHRKGPLIKPGDPTRIRDPDRALSIKRMLWKQGGVAEGLQWLAGLIRPQKTRKDVAGIFDGWQYDEVRIAQWQIQADRNPLIHNALLETDPYELTAAFYSMMYSQIYLKSNFNVYCFGQPGTGKSTMAMGLYFAWYQLSTPLHKDLYNRPPPGPLITFNYAQTVDAFEKCPDHSYIFQDENSDAVGIGSLTSIKALVNLLRTVRFKGICLSICGPDLAELPAVDYALETFGYLKEGRIAAERGDYSKSVSRALLYLKVLQTGNFVPIGLIFIHTGAALDYLKRVKYEDFKTRNLEMLKANRGSVSAISLGALEKIKAYEKELFDFAIEQGWNETKTKEHLKLYLDNLQGQGRIAVTAEKYTQILNLVYADLKQWLKAKKEDEKKAKQKQKRDPDDGDYPAVPAAPIGPPAVPGAPGGPSLPKPTAAERIGGDDFAPAAPIGPPAVPDGGDLSIDPESTIFELIPEDGGSPGAPGGIATREFAPSLADILEREIDSRKAILASCEGKKPPARTVSEIKALEIYRAIAFRGITISDALLEFRDCGYSGPSSIRKAYSIAQGILAQKIGAMFEDWAQTFLSNRPSIYSTVAMECKTGTPDFKCIRAADGGLDVISAKCLFIPGKCEFLPLEELMPEIREYGKALEAAELRGGPPPRLLLLAFNAAEARAIAKGVTEGAGPPGTKKGGDRPSAVPFLMLLDGKTLLSKWLDQRDAAAAGGSRAKNAKKCVRVPNPDFSGKRSKDPPLRRLPFSALGRIGIPLLGAGHGRNGAAPSIRAGAG